VIFLEAVLIFQNAQVNITLRTFEGGFGSIWNSATTTNTTSVPFLQTNHAAVVLALSLLRKMSTNVEQPVLYVPPLASWGFLGCPLDIPAGSAGELCDLLPVVFCYGSLKLILLEDGQQKGS